MNAPVPVVRVLLLLVVALAATGCRGTTPDGRSISIREPADGATVSSPVRLVVEVRGAEIAPPDTGKMHLHVHLDGGSEYEVLTSTTGAIEVPAGTHTIEVVLAKPNHDETETRTSVRVDVGDGQEGRDRGEYPY